MSITLIVVMLVSLFAYVQTRQIIHIKYIPFAVYQFYYNKDVLEWRAEKCSPQNFTYIK